LITFCSLTELQKIPLLHYFALLIVRNCLGGCARTVWSFNRGCNLVHAWSTDYCLLIPLPRYCFGSLKFLVVGKAQGLLLLTLSRRALIPIRAAFSGNGVLMEARPMETICIESRILRGVQGKPLVLFFAHISPLVCLAVHIRFTYRFVCIGSLEIWVWNWTGPDGKC
jgi:hypothetical protein